MKRMGSAVASSVLGVALGCAALAPNLAYADEAELHYRQCMSHKKAGKLEDAERECKVALDKRADHAAALYTMGTLQRQKGQLDAALASFNKVHELEPQSAIGWAGEGSVLLRLERIDEAVAVLKQAIALDPGDIASVGNLGNALRKQGKAEEAIAMYRKALEQNPDSPDLLNNLSVALRAQRKNAEAVEVLQRALQVRPEDAALQGNYAKALRAEKRYQDAIIPYTKALKGNDKDAGLWFDLAYCYEQSGQKDKAIDAYKHHLALIQGKDAKGEAHIKEVLEKLESSR